MQNKSNNTTDLSIVIVGTSIGAFFTIVSLLCCAYFYKSKCKPRQNTDLTVNPDPETPPVRPSGYWPKMLRWHGIADTAITPMNPAEIVEANQRRMRTTRPQVN